MVNILESYESKVFRRYMNMTLGREKVCFLNTPTPLEQLETVSRELGIRFYMKRDDLTNYGTGGNKLRKLEYFVKDAQDRGATMLLTVGGAQTNHGRLTAAVAARYGFRSAIVAVDPYPGEISANLLLDGIMGCQVYLVREDGRTPDSQLLQDAVARVTKEWEEKGERVYFIPMGGSDELGALGYYDCALELDAQIREQGITTPHIIVTVGSMGTYMGLATAIANEHLDMKLTGIGIMPYRDIAGHALDYYERVKKTYGLDAVLKAEDFHINTDFDYGAYNNPVEDVRKAIYYMGRKEGIILDPCYTGKTFNAVKKLAERGELPKEDSYIMIHTGGIPGIYTKHHRSEMEVELMNYMHII